MPAETFTRNDMNDVARHYLQRVAAVNARRVRIQRLAVALLFALPIVFAIGRGTGDRGLTIREAEAAPVPSELPDHVTRFHDDSQGATCWLARTSVYTPVGISCLPDQWLKPAQIVTEGDAP